MKKRLLSMAIALAMLSTTVNIAMPINAFAENEQNTVVDEIVQEIETTDETSETEETEMLPDATSEDYSISLMAAEYTYGSLTYTVSNNQVTITDCDTSVTSVGIPAQIEGMDVVAIDSYAFSECNLLNNITLPNSISSIGYSAFSGCASLKELTLPEGITSLGYHMIQGTAISSITIPTTVKSSGKYSYNTDGALAGCTTLNEVIFADGITAIPDYICASQSYNSYIKKIVIPDSVKTIGSQAFYECSNIESLTIPDGVETIESSAFSGCTSIGDSVAFPKSIKTVDSSAFSGCTNIKSISFKYII